MADDSKNQGNINSDINQGNAGMNMDLTPNGIGKGVLTYALNAALENFDANSVNYQNEPGNEFCLEFPKNYTLIGKHFIQERNKHIFFLANPLTHDSEIGYMDNNDCVYHTLVNDPCLNFDINIPIHKIVHRITNCTTELYWPDQNGRRFLDIDNIPYTLAFGSEICNPIPSKELDCNQLNINPDFAIPQIEVADVRNGGSITAGTVQFAFQYSDALGNGYTSYYSITNPTPIADPSLITVNYNYPVGKSVVLNISNIELSGKFQYFNVAVIKTINDISSPELIGTYFIDGPTKEIIYSGQNVTNIRLTMAEIFEKFPVYSAADDVTTVSDVLVWKGLTTTERLNYQKIANKIHLQWETWRIPPGENYSDELNATNLRGYLRDEIYAVEFVPLLRSGKQCDGFHIPGRTLRSDEYTLPVILNNNPDYIDDPDKPYAEYWKIYNTATNLGKVPDYPGDSPSYKGPYEYGEFAYWESEESYPCDKDIWGELAGLRIRHHKFPDVNISPIFESKSFNGIVNLEMGDTAIFPIGIKINVDEVKRLIAESDLTNEQKADIVGFKIARGNRGTNKSIIAKGILRNVNQYERDDQTFFFANYPYNDLNSDPFIEKINNSYREECEPFDIYVFQFNDSDAEGPFIKFRYIDCNTNKSATWTYRELGVHRLCSLNKPVAIGRGPHNIVKQGDPGPTFGSTPWHNNNVSAVKYANYDIYRIYCDGSKCGRKWDVQFLDAVAGFQKEQIDSTREVKYLHVEPHTIPTKHKLEKDIPDGATIEFNAAIRVKSCTVPSPLPGSKTHEDLAYRQVFNSPETSFGQPFLGNVLKLESVMFGRGKAHFVQVKDNAKYRLLTYEAQYDALSSAKSVGNITNPNNAAAMFSVYQSYLTIYVNGITKRNYAYSFNSRADYSYNFTVPDNLGIKQRRLDLRKYIIPVIQNVGETITNDKGEIKNVDINNFQRETSVYLRTEMDVDAFPYPDESILKINGNKIDEFSRFTIGRKETCDEEGKNCKEEGTCSKPQEQKDIRVVSYYASMKNVFPTQWGQLYSYETIDTGAQFNFDTDVGNPRTIFGGDTFICRFAFKTKVPFFIDNRVGAPDESDIFFDELGNIGYPLYWHSARSILNDFGVDSLGNLTNIISHKAHYFDCPNSQSGGTKDPNRTFYDGYFYLFAYGIPNFYVESSYNVDLRQATNNREGEFWPHVSTGIPDDWVQESFVTIRQDNTYNYNVTFSKQNKENFFSHLPFDYSDKKCYTTYPFRAVYSEQETADADNRMNNWLTYKASSYFDFPQNYGRITSIDGTENRQLLVRFENKSLLYNTLYTNQTNQGGRVYLGQPLFSRDSPPLDFAETDLGYVGSQHKFLLKIPYGQISIDAKRGQVFLLNGNQAKDLSAPGSGMNRFFTDHLAFEILRYFPDKQIIDPVTKEKVIVPGVNIDNNFKDIGLHGVFDTKYDRMIITKLDYIPIDPRVQYDPSTKEFFIEEIVGVVPIIPAPTTSSTSTSSTSTSSTSSTTSTSTTIGPTTTTTTSLHTVKKRIVVSLTDPLYFCNKSWTISYSFITNSWISFHSYLPNWYIGENNFFYSGVPTCCDDDLDFEFMAGSLVPNPPTTTTTSSSTTSTSSTTTTTTTLACVVIGTVTEIFCDLEGTGTLNTIPDPEPCQPPSSVQEFDLRIGYTAYPSITFVDTTVSSVAACSGAAVTDEDDVNNVIASITGYAASLSLGQVVYDDSGTCAFVPDGWYFTSDTVIDGNVYHIVGGVVVELFACNYTTTTTSTSTTAYPGPKFTVIVDAIGQPEGIIHQILPMFYTIETGSFPVEAGETLTATVNIGGNTFSMQYDAYALPVTLEVYKNGALNFSTQYLSAGPNQYYTVPCVWTEDDEIKVILK